jgi:hypothetical protein
MYTFLHIHTLTQTVNEVLRELFEKEDGSIELVYEVIAGAGAGFIQVCATGYIMEFYCLLFYFVMLYNILSKIDIK